MTLVVEPVLATVVAILPPPAAAALLSSRAADRLLPESEDPLDELPPDPDEPLFDPEEPEEPEDPDEPDEPDVPEDPPPDPDEPLFEFKDPENPDEPLLAPDPFPPRFGAETSADRFDEPEKPLLDPEMLGPGMLLPPGTDGGDTVFGMASAALNAAAARSNAAIGVDAVPGTLVREPPEEPDEPDEPEEPPDPPEDPDPPEEPEPLALATGKINAIARKLPRANALGGVSMLRMWNDRKMLWTSPG
jgi:hypothetical protein